MTDQAVIVSEADGIITITLNRPQAKNAVNKAVAEGVSNALDKLESDSALRVAIITGAGGTFCSGMDLKAFVSGETPVIEGRGFAGLCEHTLSKPLIAAVEGYALAGGFEIAISSDLIVAAEDATFGIPETKRGLVAGAGGLVKLPQTGVTPDRKGTRSYRRLLYVQPRLRIGLDQPGCSLGHCARGSDSLGQENRQQRAIGCICQ